MIGIVIVTHAGLARELRHAAELILGPLPALDTVTIDRDMPVNIAREHLAAAIHQVGEKGAGVIILTDLFGGTPTNISVDFLKPGQVEILTGVNLPMLIKCATARFDLELSGLAGMLKDYARDSIMLPAELLSDLKQ